MSGVKELKVPIEAGNYRMYLELVNGVLHLTEKEMDVIAAILELSPQVAFTPGGRKKVMKISGLATRQALNNLIKSLKDKRILIPTDLGTYDVHPAAMFEHHTKQIIFSIDGKEKQA